MADLQFFPDDSEDNQDEGFNVEDEYGEAYHSDDDLTPLQKLEKYISSDNVYSRQMVTRTLLDTFRIMGERQEDITPVLEAMFKLSSDSEPSVRAELVEHVTHVAQFCKDHNTLLSKPYMKTYIHPILVRYMVDSNSQVRKTSHSVLHILAEHNFITISDVEEYYVHIILDLADANNLDEYRTEAVTLMTKLAPIFGGRLMEKHFMEKFGEMCNDSVFHVRKVIASNFGEMCYVLGQKNTEISMLPHFKHLCEDSVWGVRKACAECFMQVSRCCSLKVRRKGLAELFINLACDDSRWVRMAAFQSLGGFISTFADPTVTGLYISEDGQVLAASLDNVSQEQGGLLCDEVPIDSAEPAQDTAKQKNEDVKDDPADQYIINQEDTGAENKSSSSNPDADIMTLEEEAEAALGAAIAELVGDFQGQSTQDEIEDALESQVEPMDLLTDEETLGNRETEIVTDTCLSTEELRAARYMNALHANKEECDLPVAAEAQQTELEHPDESPQEEVKFPIQESTSQPTAHTTVWKPLPTASTLDIHIADSFNSFLYWREPVPEIDIDRELLAGTTASSATTMNLSDIALLSRHLDAMNKQDAGSGKENKASMITTDLDEELEDSLTDEDAQVVTKKLPLSLPQAANSTTDAPNLTLTSVESVEATESWVANLGMAHTILGTPARKLTIINGVVQGDPAVSNSSYGYHPEGRTSPSTAEQNHFQLKAVAQEVIPQELLEKYLSMIDPSQAQTVDSEIAKHCAYSLPAVAYTLGAHNWHCLRDLYHTLASDLQWKVRRTLAFSIHELAVIIGEENTERDLVPVFSNMLKDLDEVKVGVLKHYCDFIRLLSPELRRDFLPRLQDFFTTENSRYWRLREDIGQQMYTLLELYTCVEVHRYIEPLAIKLAMDDVAAVRECAFKLLAAILKKYADEGTDRQLPVAFINVIISTFAHHRSCTKRQHYCQICEAILTDFSISMEHFNRDMLPSLLNLVSDPVANVRLSLAKLLNHYILHSDAFMRSENPHLDDIRSTERMLMNDKDKDVRYFIGGVPTAEHEDSSFSDDQIPV